jgi:hypothetical protein
VSRCMNENRKRFERELHRLRGYRFKRLLVVGSEAEILAGQYHSNIKPNAVLATVCAFEVRYDLPVLFVRLLARLWRPSTTSGGRASVRILNPAPILTWIRYPDLRKPDFRNGIGFFQL